MRRLPTLLAVLGVSTLILAGCAGSTSVPYGQGCDTLASTDPEVTKLITVSGELGTEPDVAVFSPLMTDETVHAVVEAGTGRQIVDENQLTQLDMVLYSGATGKRLVATAFGDDSAAAPQSLASWAQTIDGLRKGLMCATEGSRISVAISSDDVAAGEGIAGLGIAPGEAVIAVVDVRTVLRAKADGAPQFVAGHGLPDVVLAEDGQPGVIIPSGKPPTELVAETLKLGDGPVVKAGDTVFVQYTGLTWNEKKVFDSSWGGPAAALPLDKVVPGFAQALEGQTVGSQVLAVIPPELGYGDQANAKVPANSTLVFVIDILGIG